MPSASLAELAAELGAELVGDADVRVSGLAEPGSARPGEIALVTDASRRGEARESRASAFVVRRPLEAEDRPQLLCDDPARALALLLARFGSTKDAGARGVDPRAAVEAGATVHPAAWVGPFSYLGPGASVGEGSRVEPFSYVGAYARVGARCVLGPGATLAAGCVLGDDAVLGPGAVVGYRGFGFFRDAEGWHPIPSPGGVIVEEQVEIGANSCVDSGTLSPTRVGQGAKIDNLVQVGHNVVVGERALLCAQVGLAGSVELEEGCVLGGQVGVADHLRLGRGSRVGAHSGVARDVPPGATVSGYPAIAHGRWLRASAIFARLADLSQHVHRLAGQVARLLDRAAEREP